jgi:HEPN domain-containing protein
MNGNYKLPEEWFKQAEYDLGTAKAMLSTGRYIYTVFMCHLSIEKALKGVYADRMKKNPSRTHNLNYICDMMDFELPREFQDFVDDLTNLSVPTRYPDELEKLLKDYRKDLTQEIYDQTEELLLWLKKKIG